MNKIKIAALKLLLLFSLCVFPSFSQDESCVPDSNEGPCPDVCNPMCCNYDAYADTCVPINSNSPILIILGFCMMACILVVSYKRELVYFIARHRALKGECL